LFVRDLSIDRPQHGSLIFENEAFKYLLHHYKGISHSMTACLDNYKVFDFTHRPWTRSVFWRGGGPAAIVIHEIPGLHPLVVRLADRIANAGMTVYLPSLFGEPGRPFSKLYALQSAASIICIRREFSVWATNRSSPIVEWLRALARHAHGECGGKGVGAIGLCLTGGFALAMMTEPTVIAPVLGEPSLPFAITTARRRAIDASSVEIAGARQRLTNENLSMIGLRFRKDPLVPDERFKTLRREFGERFEPIELDPADANPDAPKPAHSVLTLHLRDDEPEGPTRMAEARVIAFLRERLGVSST
jgi:dienelactone hydrolase